VVLLKLEAPVARHFRVVSELGDVLKGHGFSLAESTQNDGGL